MSWELVENPSYAGREPTPMRAACHDGSPFISIRCDCGALGHQHESRTELIPDTVAVAMRCLECGELLEFPPGYFTTAFARLRAEGWIA